MKKLNILCLISAILFVVSSCSDMTKENLRKSSSQLLSADQTSESGRDSSDNSGEFQYDNGDENGSEPTADSAMKARSLSGFSIADFSSSNQPINLLSGFKATNTYDSVLQTSTTNSYQSGAEKVLERDADGRVTMLKIKKAGQGDEVRVTYTYNKIGLVVSQIEAHYSKPSSSNGTPGYSSGFGDSCDFSSTNGCVLTKHIYHFKYDSQKRLIEFTRDYDVSPRSDSDSVIGQEKTSFSYGSDKYTFQLTHSSSNELRIIYDLKSGEVTSEISSSPDYKNSAKVLDFWMSDEGIYGKSPLLVLDKGFSNRIDCGANLYNSNYDGFASSFPIGEAIPIDSNYFPQRQSQLFVVSDSPCVCEKSQQDYVCTKGSPASGVSINKFKIAAIKAGDGYKLRVLPMDSEQRNTKGEKFQHSRFSYDKDGRLLKKFEEKNGDSTFTTLSYDAGLLTSLKTQREEFLDQYLDHYSLSWK